MSTYIIYFYDLDNLESEPQSRIFYGIIEDVKYFADMVNPLSGDHFINIFNWDHYQSFDHENEDCEPVAQKSRAYHLESEPMIWINL